MLVLPVLSETEGVSVNLLTEAAEVVAYLVVYLGQLLLRRYQRLAILRVVGTLLFQIYPDDDDLLLSRCPRLC